MTNNDVKPNALEASIKSIERTAADDYLELVVRLTNTAARALHYIADVRGVKYDPPTKTLKVFLSDEGREVIPGTISKLPEFRHLDPGSEAEIQLRVPNRLVKLSRAAPPGELAFETHQITEAEEVVVEMAWADVPFYKDTRVTDDVRLPAARWQQHKVQATKRLLPKRPKKEP